MLEYDFVRQAAPGKGGGYQAAVHERAALGWRLVQVLVEQPATMAAEYVLIFERPVPARPAATASPSSTSSARQDRNDSAASGSSSR